jgi:aminopeptidase N
MYRQAQLFSRIFLIPIVAAFVASCNSDSGAPLNDKKFNVSSTRPVADALDKRTADSRKSRIADVEYQLHLEVFENTDWFNGESTLSFELNDATTALTIDFSGGNVSEVRVNKRPIRVDYNGFFVTLPAETLQQGRNSVTVVFEHPYSEDGTGLHRFVDTTDGRTYLYTYLWPYYANRLFPSFDQPNLKAEITLTVRAPEAWAVVSTTAGAAGPTSDGTILWRFDTTPEMSTYVFSMHAGPYKIWEDETEGIPLRLMARQSMAEFVAVDEWFEVTKGGFEHYRKYFDIPYQFGKYDQLLVPDFNIGAMENIGAVTFAERRYVQRRASNRTEREARASVILHEMAHMWFGNLVTHDWWNGLWLNESFATQMSAIAAAETTEFQDTWHGFFTRGKQEAYHRDSRVTTHPIELPINSTADFFSVFDDITYEKGSSVLKQLAHYVGEENYRLGVSVYLKQYSYGTTELDDFVSHIAAASDTDLDGWSREWLYEPGFNTLGVALDCENAELQSLRVLQEAPADHPVLRSHQIDVALYDMDESGELSAADVYSVAVEGAETVVNTQPGRTCPAIVNPNHNDWAYAEIELDARTAANIGEYLSKLEEPLTRSMFLSALFNSAAAGKISFAAFVEYAMTVAESEQNIRVLQQASDSIIATINLMQRLSPETDAALATLVPRLQEQSLRHTTNESDSDLKLIWFKTFVGIASNEAGLGTARALLDGEAEIEGLVISADYRWQLLQILSRYGAADIGELLEAESTIDTSDFGAKNALTADAATPDPAVKAKWLSELQTPENLTGLSRQRAIMDGLFPANQTAIQLQSLHQVLDALPALSKTTDPYFMSSYASTLLTPMCFEESVAKMQNALDKYAENLSSTALRFLREAHQADSECLALRSSQ